jgi:hypothetical protein
VARWQRAVLWKRNALRRRRSIRAVALRRSRRSGFVVPVVVITALLLLGHSLYQLGIDEFVVDPVTNRLLILRDAIVLIFHCSIISRALPLGWPAGFICLEGRVRAR